MTDFAPNSRVYCFPLGRLGTVRAECLLPGGIEGHLVELDRLYGESAFLQFDDTHLLPLGSAAERPLAEFCLSGSRA